MYILVSLAKRNLQAQVFFSGESSKQRGIGSQRIILILKPDKDSIKKKVHTSVSQELKHKNH